MHDIFDDIASMQKNIEPLNINGLRGRVLRIKSSSKKYNREILMIYGHHSSLERVYGIAEAFAVRGNVTSADMPGFGGMDSFFSIGMKPTIDNYADYLATFIKLKYRRRKVTIVAMSLGFTIVTRMLQRYPDLVEKVDVLVSMVGFSHKNDFRLTPQRTLAYRMLGKVFSYRIPAFLFYNIGLHPTMIRLIYTRLYSAQQKLNHLSEKVRKQTVEFEVVLWRINDLRTHSWTGYKMFSVDNCGKQVNLPVHHIAVKDDQYFDNSVVEQHMRVIFNDYHEYQIVLPAHAPSIVASKEEAAPFAPKKLLKVLS